MKHAQRDQIDRLVGKRNLLHAPYGLDPERRRHRLQSMGLFGGVRSAFRGIVGGEIADVTQMIHEGRAAAYVRMRAEANREQVHGVVGVSSELRNLSGNSEFLFVGSGVSGAPGTASFTSAGDAQELYCHMDCGYQPKEFVLHFAGFHEMYMSGTAAAHSVLPADTRNSPVTSDLTGEELWSMTQLGYMPIKLLISTSVYSLGAISGIKAAFQSLAKGEIGSLTTLVYEAREQVFDRVRREAAALGAEEVVGIKTYIVELGAGLVEIFAVGTIVRKLQGMAVKTPALPAQAIIRDKDTWLSGSVGFEIQSLRSGG
jgi:uncharacterized protein YbjQ (UPF0145 family)